MRAYRLFVRPAEAASAVRTNIRFSVLTPRAKIKPFPRAGALNCLKVAEEDLAFVRSAVIEMT